MRAPAIALLALLLAPAAAAGPGYCPHGPGVVRCHDKLLGNGQDHLVVEAGDAYAEYREPMADADWYDDPAVVGAGYWQTSGPLGEEVVVAQLECSDVAVGGTCVPADWFVGTHNAPDGQDVRVGTNSPWRSVTASAELAAAGHTAGVGVGTFYFWGMQFFWIQGGVDDARNGYFDGIPLV